MNRELPKHVIDRLKDLTIQMRLYKFLAKLGIKSAKPETIDDE